MSSQNSAPDLLDGAGEPLITSGDACRQIVVLRFVSGGSRPAPHAPCVRVRFIRRIYKLLDACCCAGAASVGYFRAGFEVTGFDIEAQPNYPFEFIQADVLEVLADHDFLSGFDVIHASPPCQAYSNLNAYNHRDYPDLVAPVSLDSRRRCVDLLPSDVPATRDVFPLVGGFPFVSSAVTSTS